MILRNLKYFLYRGITETIHSEIKNIKSEIVNLETSFDSYLEQVNLFDEQVSALKDIQNIDLIFFTYYGSSPETSGDFIPYKSICELAQQLNPNIRISIFINKHGNNSVNSLIKNVFYGFDISEIKLSFLENEHKHEIKDSTLRFVWIPQDDMQRKRLTLVPNNMNPAVCVTGDMGICDFRWRLTLKSMRESRNLGNPNIRDVIERIACGCILKVNRTIGKFENDLIVRIKRMKEDGNKIIFISQSHKASRNLHVDAIVKLLDINPSWVIIFKNHQKIEHKNHDRLVVLGFINIYVIIYECHVYCNQMGIGSIVDGILCEVPQVSIFDNGAWDKDSHRYYLSENGCIYTKQQPTNIDDIEESVKGILRDYETYKKNVKKMKNLIKITDLGSKFVNEFDEFIQSKSISEIPIYSKGCYEVLNWTCWLTEINAQPNNILKPKKIKEIEDINVKIKDISKQVHKHYLNEDITSDDEDNFETTIRSMKENISIKYKEKFKFDYIRQIFPIHKIKRHSDHVNKKSRTS